MLASQLVLSVGIIYEFMNKNPPRKPVRNPVPRVIFPFRSVVIYEDLKQSEQNVLQHQHVF